MTGHEIVPADPASPREVAVVGGGISGLAAAYRLREVLGSGVDVTVFESTGRLGGKLRTIELAGAPYDVGAEAFLARRPEVGALATELGLAGDIVHPSPARARIRAGGRQAAVPAGTVMGVPAAAGGLAEIIGEAAARAVEAEPSLPPLVLDGDRSLGEVLRERFGQEVVQRLVEPLLSGVYAGSADGLGLRATMPALAAAVDAGDGSLLHAAASMLPPASGSAGTSRPPVFGAFRGGYRRLLDALRDAGGADVRRGVPVRSLARTPQGRWRLEVGAAPRAEVAEADAVVLAVPAPAAAKLLSTVSPDASRRFAAVGLASMAVVAMALPAGMEPPDRSGTLIASGERHTDGAPFTAKAFTFSSRKWPHLAGEHALLRGSVGRAGETTTLQRTDEELLRGVLADLDEVAGIRVGSEELADSAVVRWGGGLPQYGAGHAGEVAAIERSVAAVPGLAVAGAALHGVGVPACIATGDAAAWRVAAHLGAGESAAPGR